MSKFVWIDKGIRKYLFLVPFVSILYFPLFAGRNLVTNSLNPSETLVENNGQIIDQNNKPNPAVLYLLNTPGMNVQLREGGFSYDLYRILNNEQRTTNIEFHRIDFDLLGSNPNCELITSEPSPGYLNYYTTGTPEEGVTNVSSYKTVTYKNIYSGIDLEFITNKEQGIKYSFIVRPGGIVSSIRIRISGAGNNVNEAGALALETSLGTVTEEIPLSYFQAAGTRRNVKVIFRRFADNIYGFSCGQDMDANSTLVIDPIPYRVWGTYYGGTDSDFPGICSVDPYGNVFLCSNTYSTTNIATVGAHQVTFMGLSDAFLVKFDQDGVRQWGTYYGGAGIEDESTCACDPGGNVILGGRTTSSTNIATPGCFQPIFNGDDGYLVKFDNNGVRLWGTYYGGTDLDVVTGISANQIGEIFITGTTMSSDFIASPGAFQQIFGGGSDAFLVRFDNAGQRIWGTYYGGSGNDFGTSIATDHLGNIFFTGWTNSPNNIASPGAFQTTLLGGMDGYIACFNQTGNRQWGTYFGGNHADVINGVACDPYGGVVLGGGTLSTSGLATPGAFQTTLTGARDGFLVKFTTGGQRIWATYYGGEDEEIIRSCAIGKQADIYFIGWTNSISGIATPGAFQQNYYGSTDAMIAKFDSSGQRQWGSYMGGSGIDNPVNISIDTTTAITSIYLSGGTLSTDNISTIGSHQPVIGGLADSFLEKFRDCISPDSAGLITGPQNICKPANGVIYTIPPIPAATGYQWNVPPGVTITNGQNTRTITADFSVTALSDSISVYGINNCGMGDSSFLYVQVHTPPVPVINGPDTACVGQTQIYFTESGNSNYHWVYSPGGTLVAGGLGSDTSATILWNVSGNQWITVAYNDTNGCSTITPTLKDVFIGVGDSANISISPSTNNICAGTLVTFTATALNAGSNPVYQWKVNGANTGTNNPVFSYIPASLDLVSCILTSSITTCISNNPDTSNVITMTVNPNLPVSVSISPSANPFCLGTPVTFTAIPMNGGTSPLYQWQVNGVNVSTNNPGFTYLPMTNDKVQIILTSSEICTSNNPDTSAAITMIGFPGLPADVAVSASPSPSCLGAPVTFTATPINGGSNPSYQWQVNGINVGTNNPVYSYIPASLDLVSCIMTSNLVCVTNNPVSSLQFPVSISPTPTVTLTPCFDTITTTNAKPIKLKGGIPLGGNYTGPGVSVGYFYPNLAGVGTHIITYSYTNAANCSDVGYSMFDVRSASPFVCGGNLIDIRDGKAYPTVQIGGQCWFAVNLDYGTAIPSTLHQRDNCVSEKYNNPASGIWYPASYQWDELMRYDPTPATQGLCPPTWHVPTESEWATLFSNWVNNAFAAAPLKYSGYSGFNALLSGARHLTVQWDYQNFATFFWSSTPYGPYKAWAHGMNDPDYSVSYYPALRSNAFSVRCIRD